jgi:hypothetical protein
MIGPNSGGTPVEHISIAGHHAGEHLVEMTLNSSPNWFPTMILDQRGDDAVEMRRIENSGPSLDVRPFHRVRRSLNVNDNIIASQDPASAAANCEVASILSSKFSDEVRRIEPQVTRFDPVYAINEQSHLMGAVVCIGKDLVREVAHGEVTLLPYLDARNRDAEPPRLSLGSSWRWDTQRGTIWGAGYFVSR